MRLSTSSRRPVRILAAVPAVALLALAACSSEPPLAVGESVDLESETLEASLTVTAVTEADLEELGLEGLFGTSLDGVPWVVDYRIDLASGTRPDFSWDAVPELTFRAWTAETSSGAEVSATQIQSADPAMCPGYEADLADDVVGTYCHVFLVPEGQAVDEVTAAEVGTWELDQP